jgi:hypothetical protein
VSIVLFYGYDKLCYAESESCEIVTVQNLRRPNREVFMSSDGRVGAELEPVLVQQYGQGGLANALKSGERTLSATDAASAPVTPGFVQWFAIGLFMFGFPAALLGLFFAHSYPWAFRATVVIACLVVPPLLVLVTLGAGGGRHSRR